MAQIDRQALARRIDQALGREPVDLAIRRARLVDVATGEIRLADIAIGGSTIVAVGEPRPAVRELDAAGRFACPGFIDCHLHVESSMVVPAEFERAVLPRGTTTAICDPHELANVLGAAGIRYMLDAALGLEMTLLVNLSSCVPASAFETSGARLEAADLVPLLEHPAALGLAELMNFPGLLAKEPGLLDKLVAFAGRHLDGHAPLLRGMALDAYLAAGIRTDHECTRLDEAREKLAKGMAILLREGSVAKNVATLAPLITDQTWPRLGFCTDDRNPLEIREEGHVDHALRVAIRAGAPVMATYRAATLGAALTFGLADRGLIAAGRRADILLLDDLPAVAVSHVVCGGRLVETRAFAGGDAAGRFGRGSVQRPTVGPAQLRVPAVGRPTPVIEVIPFSLITGRLEALLPEADGQRQGDPDRGIVKAAVLERHGRNGHIGLGFVQGFGPLRGAIASSVGHDSHNLAVVGDADGDMAAAVNHLIGSEGGCCVVQDGEVLASLPLPVAGLMSPAPYEEVADRLVLLRAAARAIGCTLEEPLLQLAFLPLPVIPHLKLTDQGLVEAGPDGLAAVPL